MISGFHEVRFPTNIALGALGGPTRNTEVTTLASGHEQRNTRWKHSRRNYNAGYGMKSVEDLYQVVSFFEERRGRLYGFRFRDPLDNKSSLPSQGIGSTDQAIGQGDGVSDTFILSKTYGVGNVPYVRPIVKPVDGTVLVAVDGIDKIVGDEVFVSSMDGTIEFQAGNIPDPGSDITAGFSFDVPVRFDTDEITVNLKAFEAGEIPAIPLSELLL